MKKISLLLLTGIMVCSLAACGSNDDQGVTDTSESSSVVEESTGTADESTESDVMTEESTDGTSEEEFVDEMPSAWSDEMTGFKDAVAGVLGNDYFPQMAVTADMLPDMFGLTEDMYDDYLAEMPMISVNPDTLLIVKAKDGKVKDVEAALNSWRDAKIEDGHMYPASAPKYQGSKIETIGNYVILSMLGGDNMAAMEQGDDAAIKHSQEHNDKAIEAIRGLIEQQ
ncbi:MAG: DUF4358 domain-containing protein [Lachnospiraceae bacterium]|nr:DUF4358 domain-containing protein [Lachnospiraceae bacterium]